MSKVELVARASLTKDPDYSGCSTAVGSAVTACPTSDRDDDSAILEVYFINPDGDLITEITYEDEVFLVVKTKNLEGEDVIIDFLAEGGDFDFEKERIGIDNVLKLSIASAEEKIRLEPIPGWPMAAAPEIDPPNEENQREAPDTSIKLLVKEAGGPQGQELEADVHYEFWVKSFNRSFLPEEAKGVKWMWKIDGGYNVRCVGEELLVDVDGVFMPGIKLSFNPNFIGKKIYVMPYMNSPSESVSVQVSIVPAKPVASERRGLIITTAAGKELFVLDDGKPKETRITAKQAYDRGIQWFEPHANNYMRMISKSPGLELAPELDHFDWDQIAEFAAMDRSMIDYRSNGPGDWKAGRKFLITVSGQPYWHDAVGQIPFAVNCYKNKLKSSKDVVKAMEQTIKAGMEHSEGQLIPSKPSQEAPRQYDNHMIYRGITYASRRYKIDPYNEGELEDINYDCYCLASSISPGDANWITRVYEDWDDI